MNRRLAPYLVAAMVFVLPLLAGCSLIGLGVGISSSKPASQIDGWELVTADSGRKITVSFKNGNQLSGRYSGVVVADPEQYQADYDRWRASDPHRRRYPEIGSMVTVTPDSGENVAGIFRGFDDGRVNVSSVGRSPIWDLADVSYISDSTDTALPSNQISDELSFGTVPLLTAFVLDASTAVRFHAREVESITVHGKSNAGIGFISGLVIDAMAVAIMALTTD